MSDKYIYYDYLDIYDDKIFTEKRVNDWKQHLLNCYVDIYKGLQSKLDLDSPVCFNLSLSLLDEVLVDAVIGMRKIVDSENNTVDNPNAFKVAAYLSYWWLRHKPVYLHYPTGYRLEGVHVKDKDLMSDEEGEKKSRDLCWQLKHINELVAVQIVITYIFNMENTVCGDATCAMVRAKEKERFCFSDFEEMREGVLRKLTYYFSYRTIAPKVIEHMLEAYTFHPAWGLSGPHWNVQKEEKQE